MWQLLLFIIESYRKYTHTHTHTQRREKKERKKEKKNIKHHTLVLAVSKLR